MRALVRRALVSTLAAALLGTGVVLGVAPAQAQWQPGCAAYPVNNTAAYSQCYWPVRHQVRIECRHSWGWFGGPWGTYQRWGNVAWDGQQSWARCDFPGTLVRWEVVHPWW